MIAERFHAHLNGCERCSTSPFSTCPIGRRLLQEAGEAAGVVPRRAETELEVVERFSRTLGMLANILERLTEGTVEGDHPSNLKLAAEVTRVLTLFHAELPPDFPLRDRFEVKPGEPTLVDRARQLARELRCREAIELARTVTQ